MKIPFMRIAGIQLALLLVALAGRDLAGQSLLSTTVSLHYQGERLERVLREMAYAYDLQFVYSEASIPVDRPIFLEVEDELLPVALDQLFDQTLVVYRIVERTVLLKEDPDKRQELELLSSAAPIRPLWRQEMERERIRLGNRFPELRGPEFKELPGGDRLEEIDLDEYRLARMIFEEEEEEAPPVRSDHALVQVQILPFLGTNAERSHTMTNNFSVNVFWGANGGVDGVEIGGLVNTVTNDVEGIQIAGLANTVGGSVSGTQVGGLFNVVEGHTHGIQLAAGFNVTRQTDAVQVGGLFNIAAQDASGLQLAGAFNVGSGKAGVQAAALFNRSGDSTRTQLAGLFNSAGDVSGAQVSALFNKARYVKGFQLGLINVADTVEGASFGLLNFVKRGYNRIEVGSGEALYANLGFKLGTRSFYNILHLGARWDRLDRTIGETAQQGMYMSWGLGYGIGTVATFNPRWHMNIEAVAIHVNEYEKWTDRLNLLSQLRLTIDKRTAGRASFFFGPVANLMLSKVRDPETGAPGSNIPPYTLLDETRGDTNMRAWVGGYAGIRF